MRKLTQGFTLIELLIVVAIIAILAAIAIPNFIEAQVRSKVSRAKTDMRSIATAIEAYRMDSTGYPRDMTHFTAAFNNFGLPASYTQVKIWLDVLTTPISYMTSIPLAPFAKEGRVAAGGPMLGSAPRKYYAYGTEDSWTIIYAGLYTGSVKRTPVGRKWVLSSVGPDGRNSNGTNLFYGETFAILAPEDRNEQCSIYDSTNGTKSAGDISRAGP